MTKSEFNGRIDQLFYSIALRLEEWCTTPDGSLFKPLAVEPLEDQGGIDFV